MAISENKSLTPSNGQGFKLGNKNNCLVPEDYSGITTDKIFDQAFGNTGPIFISTHYENDSTVINNITFEMPIGNGTGILTRVTGYIINCRINPTSQDTNQIDYITIFGHINIKYNLETYELGGLFILKRTKSLSNITYEMKQLGTDN
jgi:hypothetical protein